MAVKDLGANLRRYLKMQSMSIKDLAEKTNLGTATISNILNGKANPNSNTLINISEALGVSLDKLIADVPEIKTLRFRTNKTLSAVEKAKRDNIVFETGLWMQRYAELEETLKDWKKQVLQNCNGLDPQKAAAEVRNLLGYSPEEPIYDLKKKLEENGVKILFQPFGLQKTFGLSANEEGVGRAIVVNDDEKISVERKNFTMAHELGHLVLHSSSYHSDKLEEQANEEEEANEFASKFLMPEEAFKSKWNEFNQTHFVDTVLNTKKYFNVSYKTVLMRLGILFPDIKDKIFIDFSVAYKKKYHHDLKEGFEPFPAAPQELQGNRYEQLVREAYDKGEISAGYAAEMLGLSTTGFREKVAEWKQQSAMQIS